MQGRPAETEDLEWKIPGVAKRKDVQYSECVDIDSDPEGKPLAESGGGNADLSMTNGESSGARSPGIFMMESEEPVTGTFRTRVSEQQNDSEGGAR